MIDKLIDLSLGNRLLVVVLAILLMFAGYWSYNKLPVDAFPDVSPNLVQVFTVTDGLAPEEIEMHVTYPVEAAMTGLPGIEKIRSVSNFGLSVVNVYFEDGMDMYFCRQLVNERLSEARAHIPEGFGEPEMGPISTGMGLVLFYYLHDTTGTYTLEELRTMQDWIVKFNLQTVPGVTEVLGIGGYEKQYQVIIDPQALLRYDVSINDVIQRVRANNLNVGAQFIEKNAEELVVRSVGLTRGIDDLKKIVIKSVDGRIVYLDQLADIQIGGAIRRGLQTRNGDGEVVAGMVIKLYGTNASTVINQIEDRITKINLALPQGVKIVPYYQQKEIVEASVNTVTQALIQGIVLVAIVLLLFMGGLRPSLVVAIAIPFSVLFAFIAMKYFDLSANLMSLGGLAIAIGMMVDGTIVVVENIDRHFREGHEQESRIKLVARACKEVGRPIVFAIAIIILVFLPLLTLQGVEGKMFKPLAYTVSLAMLGSLVFAILLAPVCSDLLMRRRKRKSKTLPSEPMIVRLLLIPYRPLLKLFIKVRLLAVLLVLGLLGLGISIFPQLGSEFTPKLREGTIVVRLSMAPSISINESRRNTLIVEKLLLEIPEVSEVTSRVGRGEVGAHADPVNSAEMFVILKPKDQWRDHANQQSIEESIRRTVDDLPGIQANLTQPIEMAVDELLEGVKAELAIKLYGDDLDTLVQAADQIAQVVGQVEGATDVQVDQVTGTPQLLIEPDRQAIARFGLNMEDVQNVIQAAVGGMDTGEIFENIRRFPIHIRFASESRDNAQAIGNILIDAPDGLRVPLNQVAQIRQVVGPRQITREDNQRFISIQCNVVGRDIGTFVADAQKQIDTQLDLPAGYLTQWGGQFRLQQQANKRLAVVVPVTLMLILILLYSSFQSLKNALLILLNIPLALVGGVLALWLTNQNLSVPSSIGFIALLGIAVENGMVLVTCINELVSKGHDMDAASEQGAAMRLRPVLMTAVTTALGLIPLLYATGTGSEVQRPLATVVIGGLVTSTLLTLLVLPALYRWFGNHARTSH
tara:strand:+ start:59523 stop:62621 length:3099 start_codon:yes stop_codon:yes gene_type:complete